MDAERRIARLERRVLVLTAALLAAITGVVAGAWTTQSAEREVLRVRQITVVDANGTDRVWIGAPVADPPSSQGKQLKRASVASGIILLDAHGHERGGFLTSDSSGEIWLGLDSERGQEATFLANAAGGAHLSLWDEKKNQAKLSLVGDRPLLMLKHHALTVFEQPPPK